MNISAKREMFKELADSARGDGFVLDSLRAWRTKWIRELTIANKLSAAYLRTHTKSSAFDHVLEVQAAKLADELMKAGPVCLEVVPAEDGSVVLRRQILVVWDGKP